MRKVSESIVQRGESSVCRWQCSSIRRCRNLNSCRGVRRLPSASFRESSLIAVVDQLPKPGGRRRSAEGSGRQRPEAVAGQIVERRAGPAEGLDHVELVGTSAVVELLVFLFEVIRQLDRQQ